MAMPCFPWMGDPGRQPRVRQQNPLLRAVLQAQLVVRPRGDSSPGLASIDLYRCLERLQPIVIT